MTAYNRSFLGVVTNLIPGLVESQSRFRLQTAVASTLEIAYAKNPSSIYSLGTFARVLAPSAATNVIVFGLVLR